MPSPAVSVTVAIVLVALASVLHWRGWGLGAWRGGPRVAALALITVGWAISGAAGPVFRTLAHGVGVFSAGLVQSMGHPGPSGMLTAIGANGAWIVGLGLFAVWVLALLPGVSEAMTYPIAWAGLAIPGLLVVAPEGVRRPTMQIIGAVGTGVRDIVSSTLTIRGH